MKHGDRDSLGAARSILSGANASYLEALYAEHSSGSNSQGGEWAQFFLSLAEPDTRDAERVVNNARKPDAEQIVALPEALSKTVGAELERARHHAGIEPGEAVMRQATRDTVSALMMIRAYRTRGHLHANLDPLGLAKRETNEELDPSHYGFPPERREVPIFVKHALGSEFSSINQMLKILERTYCSTLGVEFMHITHPGEKRWIQERIEGVNREVRFTRRGKRAILSRLIEAEGFERFLGVKYTGTKRFGLDGGESLVPALEQILKRGTMLGVREVVVGMAHRGRLNVLAQVMRKPLPAIFHEFKGGSFHPDDVEGSGDVKYHLGASSDRAFDGHDIHLSLTANPSHLEIVDPVVLGKVRSKQDQLGDRTARTSVLPLLIHGDAAFAGQGVVAECFGLSGLKGYRTGGSIHIVVNNQIGFTTNPRYSRSSPYPSDVAKMIEAPILHVNGDDPEAVVYAAKVGTEFRQEFGKPVVIDMFCYRRFGHNESDEPAFTQPIMYRKIAEHPTTLSIYGKRLQDEGLITADEIEAEVAAYRGKLEADFEAGQAYKPNRADWLDGRWSGIDRAEDDEVVRRGQTGVEEEVLQDIGQAIARIPDTFRAHKTIRRILNGRRTMVENGKSIDWATAETLSFASLLMEGVPVRLSGQDSERGTFSQRHAVIFDQESENRLTLLDHLCQDQARFEVINSMLSEEAVLGFEYGFSQAEPNALVMWEAQFGDFANGAQVVVDQFLCAGEQKWLRMSGLVMLLPHGYEGMGPEHSSARLERYLQLCAEDNLQVANCTTPANYFHILRRQVKRRFRKPLILMTPKSLLRHRRAVSTLTEMSPSSSFHRVLWDDAELSLSEHISLLPDLEIRRVIVCSGKIYFDLFEERDRLGICDVYIIRIEQLYPMPFKSLFRELSRFRNAEMIWCQEEPRNQGAWSFIEPNLAWMLSTIDADSRYMRYVGRPASASTATGLMSVHQAQQKEILAEAFSFEEENSQK